MVEGGGRSPGLRWVMQPETAREGSIATSRGSVRQGEVRVPAVGEVRWSPAGAVRVRQRARCESGRARNRSRHGAPRTPDQVSQITKTWSHPAMYRFEIAALERCGMLCWKAAGGRQWAAVGRTRPGHPSKPSQPGFSRPGPLQKVANMPVIFRGKLLLVLNLGRLPHERRPLSARRTHRRTRRPDQHRDLRDAHPHRRVRPARGLGRGVHLVRRLARLENRAHARHRAGECAGGARARGRCRSPLPR